MSAGPMSKVREFMARVEANPDDVDALVGLGNSFLMMRAWDRALEPLEKANRIEPGNTAVLKGIGIAHFNREAFDKAGRVLRGHPEDRRERHPGPFQFGRYLQALFQKNRCCQNILREGSGFGKG